MIVLEIIIVLVIILILLPDPKKKYATEELQAAERDNILADADILSRKVRYENKSFTTRIRNIVDKNFESFKTIENIILMDEHGIEHQIPMLCATTKGVILFQTVDYPGKGLFGYVDSEEWQIAQSADIAQTVPNAILLSIENAHLIKRLTGINVKPIVVVSKYTPMVNALNTTIMGLRLILEDNLAKELSNMRTYGKQFYPDEFMIQVRDKLLSMNVANDDDDEDEYEDDWNEDEDFENNYDDDDDDVVEEVPKEPSAPIPVEP